jgi:hypothetical protein
VAEGKKRNKYVNYIRKPLAKGGFYAAGVTSAGLILFGSVIGLAVKSQGNVPLNVGAMAFSSFLFALCGLFYGVRAMFEKEKNYILAKLSVILDSLMILIWVIMLIVGLRLR